MKGIQEKIHKERIGKCKKQGYEIKIIDPLEELLVIDKNNSLFKNTKNH